MKRSALQAALVCGLLTLGALAAEALLPGHEPGCLRNDAHCAPAAASARDVAMREP